MLSLKNFLSKLKKEEKNDVVGFCNSGSGCNCYIRPSGTGGYVC